MPFVYLLRCRDGSLYAGAALDLAKRIERHIAGKASRYTRSRLPVTLVWSRRVRTWSAALREEYRIKSLTRVQKLVMVKASTLDRASAPPSTARGTCRAPSGRAGRRSPR
ncbi:MAG: GIY-YIG nuclease family protein [Planctomycetes bacterium]|nr:GIY-YIG nuclease family protein [Planctomycetota bacterium]MBI3843930.1 GIY-YIG nuclease family protein [Planctomycetota bacterium]